MGSGSLSAMAYLESNFLTNSNLDPELLAANAVKSGILNDLFSGSQVDLVSISEHGTVLKKNFLTVCQKMETKNISYASNSIKVTREEVINLLNQSE